MHNPVVLLQSDYLLIYSLPWLNGFMGSIISPISGALGKSCSTSVLYILFNMERGLSPILPAQDLTNLAIQAFNRVMPSFYAAHANTINTVVFLTTLIWLESISYSNSVSELVSRTFLPITLPIKSIGITKRAMDKGLDFLETVGRYEYKTVKGAWRIIKTLWHNTGNIFRGGGGLSA